MRKFLTYFVGYLAFWYLFFVLDRMIFLMVYHEKTSQLLWNEIVRTFGAGFKLDIAISAYIAIIPMLLTAIFAFFKTSIRKVVHIYTVLALIFTISIAIGDAIMYGFWGFRLDASPLFYMTNLKAMTASVSLLWVLLAIAAGLLLISLLSWFYLRIFDKLIKAIQTGFWQGLLMILITSTLLIIMRGGIGIASLSTSTAYFSQNQFANHAAINPVWNVGFSLSESNDLSKKYNFYSQSQYENYIANLIKKYPADRKILKSDRPNIIVIITESLTAKAVAATGGNPAIMPNINLLAKEGVVFSRLYAASDRTDKGLAAVVAGYPSLPGSSPLKYQKLTQKISYVSSELNQAGYQSSFFYGGTLNFANYRSFLVQAGFSRMFSDTDLPDSSLQTKWGAYDEVVFNKCLSETPDNSPLFFNTILTLTSHEPFKIPTRAAFAGSDDDTKYINSLHYTDVCIGNFIKEAKKRKWWDNTLIIIIADHGSSRPGGSAFNDLNKYHIPMIWLGGALNVTDTIISRIGSQTDLANTLLSQIGLKTDKFQFSNNLLSNSGEQFAFFSFANGFGYYNNDNLLIYNTVTNNYDQMPQPCPAGLPEQGKAYLQHIFTDFNTKIR